MSALQSWMAEVQQRYSANETAQLEALSDRLLSSFKEATLDLAKIISTKGLDVVRPSHLPAPVCFACCSCCVCTRSLCWPVTTITTTTVPVLSTPPDAACFSVAYDLHVKASITVCRAEQSVHPLLLHPQSPSCTTRPAKSPSTSRPRPWPAYHADNPFTSCNLATLAPSFSPNPLSPFLSLPLSCLVNHQASQAPVNELPNPLLNALASFIASVSEPALVEVLLPLVNAVVTEASGAGAGQGPAGKGKAGLFIMLAVLLRTRPQVTKGGVREWVGGKQGGKGRKWVWLVGMGKVGLLVTLALLLCTRPPERGGGGYDRVGCRAPAARREETHVVVAVGMRGDCWLCCCARAHRRGFVTGYDWC